MKLTPRCQMLIFRVFYWFTGVSFPNKFQVNQMDIIKRQRQRERRWIRNYHPPASQMIDEGLTENQLELLLLFNAAQLLIVFD